MPSPGAQSPNILAWLAGKTTEDLRGIRRGRHNFYPDAIVFYEADGTPREDPILIRRPMPDEIASARVDAILFVSKKVPKSLSFKVETVEDARKFIGHERFELIESCAIAARCMHDPTMPEGSGMPAPFKRLELLLTDHDEPAILDVYERINLLANTMSPRLQQLTEHETWLAAAFIAERENASPLAAMRAGTQLAFLIWACKRAMLTMPSSSST